MKWLIFLCLTFTSAFAADSMVGTLQIKKEKIKATVEFKTGGKVKLRNKHYQILSVGDGYVGATSAEGILTVYYGRELDNEIFKSTGKEIQERHPIANFKQLDCKKGEALAFITYHHSDGNDYGNCLKPLK